MKKQILLIASSLIVLTASVHAVDDSIKYRQNVMSAVGGHTKALVSILKGEVSHKADLLTHANGLANIANASVIENAFKENTHGKGKQKTTSTEKIWTDWDDYLAAAKRLEKAAQDIKALAEAGNLTEFDQLMPALKECGYCHRDSGFRD